MLIFSWLVWAQRTRADELSTEFLTQWCQTRDCDVPLTQVNSAAPAGNTQTQTQTDCYRIGTAISVFGSAANPNDTFALRCFIKEALREMAYGIYWNRWHIMEMEVLSSYQLSNGTVVRFNSDKRLYFSYFQPELRCNSWNKQEGEATTEDDPYLATASCRSGCLESFASPFRSCSEKLFNRWEPRCFQCHAALVQEVKWSLFLLLNVSNCSSEEELTNIQVKQQLKSMEQSELQLHWSMFFC